MKDSRPVNLNLTTIKFPLPAVTSILHRISGVVIFVGVALLLYLLELSLDSEAGFARAGELLAGPVFKVLTWAVLAGLLFHLIAGIKHLLLDMGIGESLEGGRRAAWATIVLAAVTIVMAGMWIW